VVDYDVRAGTMQFAYKLAALLVQHQDSHVDDPSRLQQHASNALKDVTG
jgi:hypothetical protein